MNAGNVQLLVVLGGNPVYTAPVDLKFTDAMQKVALRVHLGLLPGRDRRAVHWHISGGALLRDVERCPR